MKKLTPGETLLLILILAVAAVCIRLGIWQLDRLGQRLQKNAEIKARLAGPTLYFPTEIPLEDQTYRRVSAAGRFDQDQAILLENQPYNDQAGFHLLVPFIVEDRGQVLLVDRGWIDFEQGLGADPRELAGDFSGSLTIEGVLLPSQREPALAFLADKPPAPGEPALLSWRVVNLDGIQGQVPYPLYPLYLAQTAPPPASSDEPLPVFEPDLSNGPHLSYAIQWFSFAAISLVGGTALLRRQRMRRKAREQEKAS
jgi:surfeit locus 1 family protein